MRKRVDILKIQHIINLRFTIKRSDGFSTGTKIVTYPICYPRKNTIPHTSNMESAKARRDSSEEVLLDQEYDQRIYVQLELRT